MKNKKKLVMIPCRVLFATSNLLKKEDWIPGVNRSGYFKAYIASTSWSNTARARTG